jgi:phosphatidylglycerol lysyltransferase
MGYTKINRRWILWILAVGFIWVVVSRYSEAQQLRQVLAQGNWGWLLLAAAAQIAYYIAMAATYQAAFAAVDVSSRVRDLTPITLSSLFINVVAPSGGAAGAALFVDDLNRRGQSPARAAVGVFLQLICVFVSFMLILIFGLVYLFMQHDLEMYEVIAAIVLFAATAALSSALLLSLWQPRLLHGLLLWVQHFLNGLFGFLRSPSTLADDWAERNAAEFSQAAETIIHRPKRLARAVSMAFTAHGISIISLYLLFLAFNQRILFGSLVAGYAMGFLFLVVSITPMGIGVVEGVMTLVYTSLGVPSAAAAAVALVYRGLGFWLPLGLGFLLLRRSKTFGAEEHTLEETWSVRVIAVLTALMGCINMLSAVQPALIERLRLLESISPLAVRHGGHLTAALAGFALLILGRGLWRRKRTAWLAAMITLAISTFSHLIKGLDYEEALLALGLMLLMWLNRRHFHARSDPPSMRQAVWVLATSAIFTLAYGTLGFYLLDRHYSVHFNFLQALRQTIVMFTQFYDPGLQPVTGFGRYFADSIYIIGAVTLGYSALLFLRPILSHPPATPEERQRVRAIVERYGRTSLAHAALFNDKHYYFAPSGSVIAFVQHRGVAVALGDPIGPPDALSTAIAGFQQFCAMNDWTPVFYQTMPDTLAIYRQAGFEAVCIGHEAIVKLEHFTLEGGARKQFRTAIHRMERSGYHFAVHPPPLDYKTLAELRAISDEWLTMMHGSEKRFSLGWFDDEYIRSSPIAAVHDPKGLVTAFANVVSEYQANEITIDLMRRRRDVEPGTMDYLFANLLLWAKEQGHASFNLGLSALAGIGEHPDDPAVERAMHFIYQHINQFYNFKGLHEYKEKFQPIWSPRYLIYPGAGSLATAFTAVVAVNSGEENLLLEYFRIKPQRKIAS